MFLKFQVVFFRGTPIVGFLVEKSGGVLSQTNPPKKNNSRVKTRPLAWRRGWVGLLKKKKKPGKVFFVYSPPNFFFISPLFLKKNRRQTTPFLLIVFFYIVCEFFFFGGFCNFGKEKNFRGLSKAWFPLNLLRGEYPVFSCFFFDRIFFLKIIAFYSNFFFGGGGGLFVVPSRGAGLRKLPKGSG